MQEKHALLLASIAVALSVGSATAYATSCLWPATTAELTPVAVTLDGEAVEPGIQPLRFTVAEVVSGPARLVIGGADLVTIELEQVQE